MTDEEEALRARYIQPLGAYIFGFRSNKANAITGFVWQEMRGGKGIFHKVGAAAITRYHLTN